MKLDELFNQNFKTYKNLNEKIEKYGDYNLALVYEAIENNKDIDEVLNEAKSYLKNNPDKI